MAWDYSSSIVLFPLHVGCHIKSRTKQQWVKIVNSWLIKGREKCGSFCTFHEFTNRCQTTQLKVACPKYIGEMCIRSKTIVEYKEKIIHRLLEGNICIADSDWCR